MFFVVGDWNTNTLKFTPFGDELRLFCDEYGYILSDLKLILDNTKPFTYISDSHNTVSWLDHCVSTRSAHSAISDMRIIHTLVGSVDRPILMSIKTDVLPRLDFCRNELSNLKYNINWSDLTSDEKLNYTQTSAFLLNKIEIPRGVAICNGHGFTNQVHMKQINDLYADVVKALSKSSNKLTRKVKRGHRVIPSWNDCISRNYTTLHEMLT
jgi:hypothetical protein